MALDPNIILQGQAPRFDSPLETMSKAMTLKSLANQNQIQDQQLAENQAIKSAFRNNMAVGPDGAPALNRKAVLSDIMRVDPTKAIDYRKLFEGQDLDELKKHTEIAKNLSWSILPDGSNYKEVRQKAIQLGLPNVDKMPEEYSPGWTQNWQVHTLSGEEQLKKQEIEAKIGATKEEKNARLAKQNEDRDSKAAADLDRHLAQGWAGRSGNAGKVQEKINNAEYAEGIIKQGEGQKNGLDSRQIEELANATAKLLGGSAAASARIEALVPHTMIGRTQTLKEWLTNEPQGAQAQEFVKRMAETVQREKAIASDQKLQFQIEGLPAHSGFKKRNPDLYNQILQAKQIDPSMIDEKGRYKKPSQAPPDTDFHSLSDDELDQLYKKAGGK